jgi:nucleotide-binding universal stress UspA family protein
MKTILAAVDFSEKSKAVTEQAGALAKALGAKLWLLHVTSDESQAMAYEPVGFSGEMPGMMTMPGDIQLARDLTAEECKREHAQLLSMSAELRENGVDCQASLLKGAAAKLIVEKAGDLDADIIVIASHGYGLLHKVLLGSVSEAVLRHAPCNVMVVPTSGK